MTIAPLPVGYKVPLRFTRPENIKKDTHYLFTTEKYVVEVVYHSSMFYAPEFYKVTVKNHAGEQIWSGGDAIFLDTLFREDFISDRFNRLILTRVNSTESSSHLQIVLIDLLTGKETELTEEGDYRSCGHFISFDCIYFERNTGINCIDFGTNNTFNLIDILTNHFTGYKVWSRCPVKDCILVICTGNENSMYLFNLRNDRIEDQLSFQLKKSDAFMISVGSVPEPDNVIITVTYSQRQESGTLKHTGTEAFKLVF